MKDFPGTLEILPVFLFGYGDTIDMFLVGTKSESFTLH